MEMQKTFTLTLSELEAARLSEALYAAVSNKSLWTASDFDLNLCESIINQIGKLEV